MAGRDVPTAAPLVPEGGGLEALRAAAAGCRACPLGGPATQTVFGEGPPGADVALVGEVPGDREDREGRPFVGPAGRLLDEALEAAGIDRAGVYLTNAVKHFKFHLQGARRIHDRPGEREIAACRPWLDAELERLSPRVVVALGATAAKALLGRGFRVTRQRGELFERAGGGWITATVHPSSILRSRGGAARREGFEALVRDLGAVADALSRPARAGRG